MFGLPGHFPCPLPAAPVSWPGSSPSSSSRRGPCRAWGFQGPLVVLVWGLRFRGAPRQCCARSHVSGKPPTPHSGQAVLVTTSLREAGWVVTAAPPASVVCRLHVDFCHRGSLEQRSVAASAIFNVPTRSSHWLCLAVRRRSSCRHRPASVRYYRVNTQSCCRSCLCRKVCTCLCTCQQAGRL